MKMTDDLIRIASAGGGLEIAAGSKMTDDLIRIASAGGRSGASLRITGAGTKMTNDLIRIASAGAGRVTFVFE
jgi:hypothetical protein